MLAGRGWGGGTREEDGEGSARAGTDRPSGFASFASRAAESPLALLGHFYSMSIKENIPLPQE